MPFLQPSITRVASGTTDGVPGTNIYVTKGKSSSHEVIAAGQGTIPSGSAQVSLTNLPGVDTNCIITITGRYLLAGNPGYFVASSNTNQITVLYVNPATGGLLTAAADTPFFYSVMKVLA